MLHSTSLFGCTIIHLASPSLMGILIVSDLFTTMDYTAKNTLVYMCLFSSVIISVELMIQGNVLTLIHYYYLILRLFIYFILFYFIFFKEMPSFFIFYFYKQFHLIFIYLFMAVLGLRFCVRAFSSCGKRGPLFIAVRGPLTVTASLAAEHRLQTRRLSSCGSRA